MEDLMGMFGGGPVTSNDDLMNGFGSLDLGAGNQPPPPGEQLASSSGGKKTNEDLLGLF